jgi:hypothetical protein
MSNFVVPPTRHMLMEIQITIVHISHLDLTVNMMSNAWKAISVLVLTAESQN